MHLVLSLTIALATSLFAPTIASACCPDFDRHEPIGWSTDGRLLVGAYEATMCEGTSTLEVLPPGSMVPAARFDRYRDSRRLAPAATPRTMNEEAMWEMEDEAGEGVELFPIPARLEREFAEPARALCRADVLALGAADPGDPAGTEFWDSHVQVLVGIRTDSGFSDVATEIRLARFIAEVAEVYVHPSPGSRRALLRISWDHHDHVGDELRWIELPNDAPTPAEGCDTRSAIIPLRANLTGPDVDEARYLLASALTAQDELARATSEDEAAELAARIEQGLTAALWAKPESDAIRAALVDALENGRAPEIAAVVASELPDRERTPLAAAACAGDGGCGPDAGAAGATEPGSASGASCGASHASSSVGLAFPALVFAGGIGISAARRRRG